MRNLSRYINETGAYITNNKFNKQSDASFIRKKKMKKEIQCWAPFENQTAYCMVWGLYIRQKVHHVVWSLLCVCVYLISSEKKYPNPSRTGIRTPNMCWTHSTGGGSRNLTERMSFWVVVVVVTMVVVWDGGGLWRKKKYIYIFIHVCNIQKP